MLSRPKVPSQNSIDASDQQIKIKLLSNDLKENNFTIFLIRFKIKIIRFFNIKKKKEVSIIIQHIHGKLFFSIHQYYIKYLYICDNGITPKISQLHK